MEVHSKWGRSLDLEPSTRSLREQSSENLDMDWEKFTASVDVLEGCRATTMPAEGDRPALTNIFTGNTARSLPQDISVKCGSPDRLIINLAEYRKGYHYSVECPQQENLTPRRVLDQQGSNDFTSYMQEHAGSPIFSPELHMASSPFAAQNRQPFEDGASCRSRLSDYGYDTESESEKDYGDYGCEEDYGECYEQEAAPDQDAQGTKRRAEPFEDCGFWAVVGASESQECKESPTESQGTGGTESHFHFSPQGLVEWEVNEWDSASDRGKRHCAPGPSVRKELFPDPSACCRGSDGVPCADAPDQAHAQEQSPDLACPPGSDGVPRPDVPGQAQDQVFPNSACQPGCGGVPSPDAPDLAQPAWPHAAAAPGPQTVLLPWDMD
ncbi:hypothetical protein COCOBI_04-0900 [Coccomyxa sp. Obi]|nr:hypothetical protein COCOBI_04-0900 [Coccomyxa sp. Obi]